MSTTDIQEKFKALVESKEKLSSEKIQLETKISVAKDELKTQYEALKKTYNVETLEEAESLLKKLESEITEKVTECEEFLKEFEV